MRRKRKRKRRTLQGHVESNVVDVVVAGGGGGERMLDCTLNLKNYHYYNTHFIG